MPLGTLDSQPPPFFRQGPSAQSKLAVYSALAIFLMVADARFGVMQPVRAVLATALYPVQWVAMLPVRGAGMAASYLESLNAAQEKEAQAHFKLASMSARANQVEQLTLENERLRKLLDLRGRTHAKSLAAQVLYDAADPFSRKVIIDKGMSQGVALGSPVLDESGVIGQVTRLYPLVSEVSLVIDRDQSIPVLNVRTGARGVAFGDMSTQADGMELRYMAANADVSEGDILNTSGVDGVYPAGLPVARVARVERRVDTIFARIYLTPIGRVSGTNHVLVLEPVSAQIPVRPSVESPSERKGGGK